MARERCATVGCGKRLDLTSFACRCGLKHCGEHRAPETHACTFDWAADGRARVAKTLLPVLAPKLLEKV